MYNEYTYSVHSHSQRRRDYGINMSTVNIDDMRDRLIQLGFSTKEVDVYLAALELGNQAASTIARKTGYPKSTVLFLLNGLVEQGYVQRSQQGRVQYFFCDPRDLLQRKKEALAKQREALEEVVPLLEEYKSPYSSQPRVTFYEGIEGCRKVYSKLLESTTDILEFGAHEDLVNRLGSGYMDEFIAKRKKKKIFLRAISQDSPIEQDLIKLDKKQCREIQLFPDHKGKLYSSIAIYENKVLLLSLFHDAFGILIENKEVADTMRTIFELQWKPSNKKRQSKK